MQSLPRRGKLLLLAMAISTLVFLFLSIPPKLLPKPHDIHVHSHLQAAAGHCSGTLYPDLCVSTLTTIANLSSQPLSTIIATTINQTLTIVRSASSTCSALLRDDNLRRHSLGFRQTLALNDCIELFEETISDLHHAVIDLSDAPSRLDDIQTVLSAAMTNQYTCLDGFAQANANDSVRPVIARRLRHISHLVSNSLAMSKRITRRGRNHRREAFEYYGRVVRRGFPAWISAGDRRLLQSPANATLPDIIVAKDGTGNFTTVGDAVAAAPNNSATRFVIYIKAGAYFENVEVTSPQTNLMFVGDGIGKTVIKARRNVVDGWTTFRSATVAVVGKGFLARDITIENSAGPSKNQAVALRSDSDFSAFYRCSFVGYQDTLYVHSLRQFYRNCDIYGTVDFIFGNAAVVFQSCSIYARKPSPNQQNVFTAQGREDPNQNTGILIQNCKVSAASDLIPVQSSFKTFLGRPWKEYSRTVFLESYLDGLIEPAGWKEWNGTFALSSLYYGEYMNRGPGSNTTSRVTWPGYHVITNTTEASNFTVASFIQGDEWLGSTMIPYSSGLS